jgi:phage terminase large subunit GpA-like protein
MDCLSPTSPVERIVIMKGVQVAATEMGNNWIGYVIHHAPGLMYEASDQRRYFLPCRRHSGCWQWLRFL